MCIIAVSEKGIRQPTAKQLRNMFDNNPHGAGYMYARNNRVTIHKGFMSWEDFDRAVKSENFTADDSVVYHFRISTQAGVNPEMTHPFPLTNTIVNCRKLDLRCPVGVAHNGVIRMTADFRETRYSDTALFIAGYMTKLIRNPADITDKHVIEMIDVLTNSKWAIMDGSGRVVTVGNFINDNGLLFSNNSFNKAPGTYILHCKSPAGNRR